MLDSASLSRAVTGEGSDSKKKREVKVNTGTNPGFLFLFWRASWLVESQFPDHGSNSGPFQ